MGAFAHLRPVLKRRSKMSLIKSTLIFTAIVGLVIASATEENKDCAHLKGCNDKVECCNKGFHCVRGPNQSEGICAPWLQDDKKPEDCVVHRGCQKPSDCCNKQFTCAHFAGQDDGVCMPWLIKEEDCVKTYHQGCKTSADCCQKGLMCAHFAGQPSGTCRHWLAEGEEDRQQQCVGDFETGCQAVDGSDCCNDQFMCINGRCQNWVPIQRRPTRRPHHHRTTTAKPVTRRPHPHHHKSTTHKTTLKPATHKPHHHHHHQLKAQCRVTSDCPKLHLCQDGTCRPKFVALMGRRQNVGCPKCRTVADCPKYAHCGFNGCCQFW